MTSERYQNIDVFGLLRLINGDMGLVSTVLVSVMTKPNAGFKSPESISMYGLSFRCWNPLFSYGQLGPD